MKISGGLIRFINRERDKGVTNRQMQSKEAKARLSDMIDQYQDLVFTVCYRYTSDYFASQDLAQDTFITAYAHLDEIEAGKEKSYLARVAVNHSIDYLRKRKREELQPDEELAEIPEETSGVEREAEERDLRRELEERCRKLKDPYAEVAYRYFYREQTAEEISEQLNEKAATIKTRIYRARDMLREIYRKEGMQR